MNLNEPLITRRRALHLTFAIAGTTLAQSIPSLRANDSDRAPTPENVLGPFYPVIRSMEKDADLTTIRGHKRPAEGKIIHLMGRVLDLKGEPVKGARVEIWQAKHPWPLCASIGFESRALGPQLSGLRSAGHGQRRPLSLQDHQARILSSGRELHASAPYSLRSREQEKPFGDPDVFSGRSTE